MEEFKKRLVHLSHCQSIGPKNIFKLLKQAPSLSNLYELSVNQLNNILQDSSINPSKLYNELQQLPITKMINKYNKENINFVTFFDKEYPYMLKQIYNPPLVLYMMGDARLLSQPSLAIVGSRKANHYAGRVLNELLPEIIRKEIVIVSGLAKGVDSLAHSSTIKYGGKTIGVLGSGFFNIYPQENRGLAENMKREHLLISEYPPYVRAQKWHFPMRNRIINGLSKGTLVIQAEERSGSLITAEYALQEGREVLSVPGALDDPLSKGTNFLIQQGAKLVLKSEDILEELNL